VSGIVTYTSVGAYFEIVDGEVSVYDCTTAKGSSPEATDKIYIFTDNSRGILGIQNGETMPGYYYIGKSQAGDSSIGELRIYGGGKAEPVDDAAATFIIAGYGMLTTGLTSRDAYAEVDLQEWDNDFVLKGAFDCSYIKFTSIKADKYIDLDDCHGSLFYPKFECETATDKFYLKGVPGLGFFPRGCDLQNVYSGIFTSSSYPDIDLDSDVAVAMTDGGRMMVPKARLATGRPSGYALENEVYAGEIVLKLRIADGQEETVYRDLEYIHAKQLNFLLVVRSHGSDKDFPDDIMIRGRLASPCGAFDEGIDFRTIELRIVEDA